MLVSSILHSESWSRDGSTPHQQQLLHSQAMTCRTKTKKSAAWLLQLQGSALHQCKPYTSCHSAW